MKIEVTQELIDGSTPRNSAFCFVASSMRVAGLGKPRVGLHHLSFITPAGKLRSVPMPPIVRDRIVDGDLGRAVKPFSFEIEIPT